MNLYPTNWPKHHHRNTGQWNRTKEGFPTKTTLIMITRRIEMIQREGGVKRVELDMGRVRGAVKDGSEKADKEEVGKEKREEGKKVEAIVIGMPVRPRMMLVVLR